MWTVWVLGSVRIGMMHSVKNGVGSGRKIGAALPHPGKEIKELFPVFAHHEHLMCCVAMKEETLAKQGEIPVKQEEDNDNHLV